MKNYRREYPLFSLCGLNCGLCPIHHMEKGCPGCGGGEGHQSCAIVKCSQQRGKPEYCFMCGDYPCERYQQDEYDSFLPHCNKQRDLKRAGQIGIGTYRAELKEKKDILEELLAEYNDGRRKSFFCVAVNLLDLPDIRKAMGEIRAGIPPDAGCKEKSAFAVDCFQAMAQKRGIALKLNRKPKRK